MNSILKKTLSILLVSMMFFETAAIAASNVTSNSVLRNALYNYTPSQSVKITDSNGNTVKSMYYTGGFHFRFNNDAAPQPLWNISPPQIEAGCNGLNLKGMFVSILGLDQFGAMLQNAGTTLAWGVGVGLIYSLPGIASTFKMINQWAKDIQKLLSMACSSGIAIGEAIGSKIGEGLKETEFGKKVSSVLDSAETIASKQAGLSGKLENIGITGLNASWSEGFTFTPSKTVPDRDKEDLMVGPLQQLFGDTSIGGSLYMDYLLKGNNNPSLKEIRSKLDQEPNPIVTRKLVITLDDGIQKFDSEDVFRENIELMKGVYHTLDEQNDMGLKFLGYALYYNMVGDIGFTDLIEDHLAVISKAFKCAKVTANSSESGAAKSKTKPGEQEELSLSDAECEKVLADVLFDKKTPINPTLVGKIQPEFSSGTQIKKFVLEGVTDSSNGKFKDIIAPEFLIIATKENSSSEKSFAITPTNPTLEVNFFGNNKFGGTKVISQCSLYKELSGAVPEHYLGGLKEDENRNAIDCDAYPNLIFGDIKLYADILYKSDEKDMEKAINKMKFVNEYLLSEAILSSLGTAVTISKATQAKLSSNDALLKKAKAQYIPNEKASGLIQSQIEKFSKSLIEAKKALDDDYPEIKRDRDYLSKYFEDLEKKISKKSLQRQK